MQQNPKSAQCSKVYQQILGSLAAVDRWPAPLPLLCDVLEDRESVAPTISIITVTGGAVDKMLVDFFEMAAANVLELWHPRAKTEWVVVDTCSENRERYLRRLLHDCDAYENTAGKIGKNDPYVNLDEQERRARQSARRGDAALLDTTSGLMRYVHFGERAGTGIAEWRNAGIQVATGQIIVHMDDDLYMLPHWASLAASILLRHPAYQFVSCSDMIVYNLVDNCATRMTPVYYQNYVNKHVHAKQSIPCELPVASMCAYWKTFWQVRPFLEGTNEGRQAPHELISFLQNRTELACTIPCTFVGIEFFHISNHRIYAQERRGYASRCKTDPNKNLNGKYLVQKITRSQGDVLKSLPKAMRDYILTFRTQLADRCEQLDDVQLNFVSHSQARRRRQIENVKEETVALRQLCEQESMEEEQKEREQVRTRAKVLGAKHENDTQTVLAQSAAMSTYVHIAVEVTFATTATQRDILALVDDLNAYMRDEQFAFYVRDGGDSTRTYTYRGKLAHAEEAQVMARAACEKHKNEELTVHGYQINVSAPEKQEHEDEDE